MSAVVVVLKPFSPFNKIEHEVDLAQLPPPPALEDISPEFHGDPAPQLPPCSMEELHADQYAQRHPRWLGVPLLFWAARRLWLGGRAAARSAHICLDINMPTLLGCWYLGVLGSHGVKHRQEYLAESMRCQGLRKGWFVQTQQLSRLSQSRQANRQLDADSTPE